LSAAVIVVAAHRLAIYGDVIAVRTGLGGLLVGTILMAGATSLPELLTAISAFRMGEPDLGAGALLGSNMVNVLLIAIVDLLTRRVPLLRGSAVTHALTAALATTLMISVAIFILIGGGLAIGWIGVDSIVLVGIYFVGVRLIQREVGSTSADEGTTRVEVGARFPSLRRGVIGFSVATIVLLLTVPPLVRASTAIADETGIGTTFVGVALLSVVTSLPELLAALAAVRIGAFDLAVGNLFGSSVFNMLILGVADVFYLEGPLLSAINPDLALVALMGLLLTNIALIGNLARVERKFLFIEIDAVAIILVYLATMYLLYVSGMAGT
jgi:cation:H+ antiporter